ncbi:MAG: preprotein translocase subunit SecY [Candidatus Nealsonbacteria bacterium CG_4_8_14_3_um_filter_39_7]|uniref:Protein translocase subunit SecY n=1 Tax=Candidatus Nealsonbacteria bacterium CG23_combo_of_CG06-09_8_20_14_all_39_17 TaxID=1974722 RepID=A0A2G9YTX1_9BACT|nr:MAG: preprotein translocase subunit SecY [Candidatus Nealsonbacteria bacterium CG23_combo_of_CG06-09_8_20_14_all_39_17]PIW91043.1 MAG: preprotein translocase subunit SecY [Candidatus Nealsonbacteria bacterium CG_4_8_14_3_um_filter_39_7]
MLFQKIAQIFKLKDLRNKIIFILAVFALFRLMANIPVPGVNAENLKNFFDQFQMFGLMNLFTGGALDNLSLVMLGLGPYITAVIIFQILTMIFPGLKQLYKEEGEAGRQKFNQYCRIATVPLATLQAYGMLMLLQSQGAISSLDMATFLASILVITAGSLFLMWLGEILSEKGIGNGVSLLIFAGIIASFPNNVFQLAAGWSASNVPSYLLFFVMSLFIIFGVVLVNEARRNIPVSYAKRVRGMKMYGGNSTYLPLSVNPAGVIPIIFAISIMLFPSMIANFFGGMGGAVGETAKGVAIFFQNPWVYGSMYFILVVLFTYFYTAVTFDPKNIAENLQKGGGFIPGIRPGASTATFIYYILNRVLLFGAIFLGLIAIMPSIVAAITGVKVFSFLIGGTSLLIMVSVILETLRQIRAQLQMRDYETF